MQTITTNSFDEIENKINGKKNGVNIKHYSHIHSIKQLGLIKKYYGSKTDDDIDRQYKDTYYETGVLVTAAIFE